MTLSAIVAWATSFLSGFLGKLVTDLVSDWRADRAQKDLGARESDLRHAQAAQKSGDEMSQIAANPAGGEDLAVRLEKGEG